MTINISSLGTELTSSFQDVTITDMSWLVGLGIALLLILIITRDTRKMKVVLFPVLIFTHIIGFRQSGLLLAIAGIFFVQGTITLQVLGNMVGAAITTIGGIVPGVTRAGAGAASIYRASRKGIARIPVTQTRRAIETMGGATISYMKDRPKDPQIGVRDPAALSRASLLLTQKELQPKYEEYKKKYDSIQKWKTGPLTRIADKLNPMRDTYRKPITGITGSSVAGTAKERANAVIAKTEETLNKALIQYHDSRTDYRTKQKLETHIDYLKGLLTIKKYERDE